jgi:hypothetical protein
MLSLCAARLRKLVLAEVVRDEVEENLLHHAQRSPAREKEKVIEHFRRLIALTHPDVVPYPGPSASVPAAA